jgi:hypothetical protein
MTMMIKRLDHLPLNDLEVITKIFRDAGMEPVPLMRVQQKDGLVWVTSLALDNGRGNSSGPIFVGGGLSRKGSLKSACQGVVKYLQLNTKSSGA